MSNTEHEGRLPTEGVPLGRLSSARLRTRFREELGALDRPVP